MTVLRYNRYCLDNGVSVCIVPTGIGASIGGFAGDASRVAQQIAEKIPVIVNPNVVNAACFSGIKDNMLYTEGFVINEFFKGNISLKPSQNNIIGVIFDKAISEGIRNVHINTMNAVKTVYGIDVVGYEVTEEPCGVEFFMTEEGISSGAVMNNETLLKASKKMLSRGADVLAVVCHFEEPLEDGYKNGDSPDIIGGVEAIISHYLSRELMVPVVHSPAFENIEIDKSIVDKRAAAEYITPTFLPCLLVALDKAPLLIPSFDNNYITVNNVHSVVMPSSALGNSIVLDSIHRNIPVYAVQENKTMLSVDKNALCIDNAIINIETYDEYVNNFLLERVTL